MPRCATGPPSRVVWTLSSGRVIINALGIHVVFDGSNRWRYGRVGVAEA